MMVPRRCRCASVLSFTLAAILAVADARASTLLFSNPMNDGSEWLILVSNMSFSFGGGVLNVHGSTTSAGSIFFLRRVDTTGFAGIVAEFDYRRAGSIVQWENSDWIRFVAFNQAAPPTLGSPIVEASQFWRGRPPDNFTTRSWSPSAATAANNANLWIGFQARTTQTGEIIQLNNFRVFGTTLIDCNGNGIADNLDIASGTSQDCGGNGIPDECEIILVNSLADPGVPNDGLTTLREAIDAANLNCGVTITFEPALAGGTIQPASPLPFITGGSITINGDVNGDCIPDIELDGMLAGDSHGLVIASVGNEIRGLTIIRFAFTGITVQGTAAESNTITCCYVGTDASGNMNLGNGREGVFIQGGSPSNSVGPWNVVSGNALSGILVEGATAANNIVFQNIVGADPSGSLALPNGESGVVLRFDAHHNSVGPGNLVSGNSSHGILLSNGVNNTLVFGNNCGADILGTFSIPNSNSGILIQVGSFDNTIGGSGPGDGNLLSGNGVNGIRIRDGGSDGNVVVENFCGTDASGVLALPNQSNGIRISNGASANIIGPNNVIAFNSSDGIQFNGPGTNMNTITTNSITQNAGKGIRRDACSQDQIERPIITAISPSMLSGSATAPDGSIIEVFHDPDLEGETFLGSTTVVGGLFSFSGTIPVGGTVTTTVTNLNGSTSEFGFLRLVAPPQPPPLPGDLVVASRTFGTVYAVDRSSGLIRGLVSGRELRDTSDSRRGTGKSLASFQTSLLSMPVNRILSRFDASACLFGLVEVDHLTGDRLLRPDTNAPTWSGAGEAIQIDDDRILVTADHFTTGGDATVLLYELGTSTTTVLSGPTVGNGPVMRGSRGLAMLDADTLIVGETGFQGPGAGVYLVDLVTGNRSFLSRLSIGPLTRTLITNGVPTGDVILGDDEGGSGPVMNTPSRSVAVVRGRIFVGEAIGLPGGGFNGGILEIDLLTGDRSLLVGQALVDDGTGSNVVEVLPTGDTSVFLDAPIGMQDDGTGSLLFTNLFGPSSIFRYDLDTGELELISDIEAQVDPSFGPSLRLSGLTIFKGLPGDLDGDGDVDGLDFAIFLVAFGHCVGEPQFVFPANTDGDECVTLVDYQNWLQHYRDFLANPLAGLPTPGDVGDMNADGNIDGLDIQGFVDAIIAQNGAGFRQYLVADINGDGALDTNDMGEFTALLLSQQ